MTAVQSVEPGQTWVRRKDATTVTIDRVTDDRVTFTRFGRTSFDMPMVTFLAEFDPIGQGAPNLVNGKPCTEATVGELRDAILETCLDVFIDIGPNACIGVDTDASGVVSEKGSETIKALARVAHLARLLADRLK